MQKSDEEKCGTLGNPRTYVHVFPEQLRTKYKKEHLIYIYSLSILAKVAHSATVTHSVPLRLAHVIF